LSTVRAKASRQAPCGAGCANRLIMFMLCLGLLLCLSACAVENWCNDLNDYSTLQADLEHCRKKAGVLGGLLPTRINSCMESLGWYQCAPKPEANPEP